MFSIDIRRITPGEVFEGLSRVDGSTTSHVEAVGMLSLPADGMLPAQHRDEGPKD
jgi:hypothetical protein